jgi:indoleamine 2,3-dioxygenase
METGRQLNPSHFLALPRPSLAFSSSPPLFLDDPPLDSPPLVDTTTLAAHDFDVDPRTGFMPPQPPLARLPSPLEEHHHYELWEEVLENACTAGLQFTDKYGGLTEEEEASSERWREQVRNLPIIAITPLLKSEILLRRAHHVLAWIMHFYIFTFPLSSSDLRIPAPITLPLLQVSRELQLPPVLTYSDTVLYNWTVTDATAQSSSSTGAIDPQKLRALTTFTSTPDEEHFFLTSARIELIGVHALACMQSTLDELFVGDSIAVRRITQYLQKLGGGSDSAPGLASSRGVIGEMELELSNMTAGCDPRLFYEVIRPWFRGIDSNNLKPGERRWIFEGMEMDEMLEEPTELSGASAGQSSIIHALDVFLGVQQYSHSRNLTGQGEGEGAGASRQSQSQSEKASFLARMQLYMPRHHRNFLNHLRNQARSLRAFVLDTLTAAGLSFDDSAMPIVSPSSSSFSASSSTSFADTIDPNDALELLHAYNAAVVALKKLRDCHIVIVARYIIGPAAHSRMVQDKDKGKGKGKEEAAEESSDGPLKGTGGTDLVQFLKGVRDGTRDAVIPVVPL